MASEEDSRLNQILLQNLILENEVKDLHQARVLHEHLQNDGVRQMLRKEIGGPIWQHGDTGKMLQYKTKQDLHPESEFQPKQTKRKSSHTKAMPRPTHLAAKGKNTHQYTTSAKVTKRGCPVKQGGKKHQENGLNDTFTIEPRSILKKGANVCMGEDLDEVGESSSLSPSSEEEEESIDDYIKTNRERRAAVLRQMLHKIDVKRKMKEDKVGATKKCCIGDCDPEVMKWIYGLNLKEHAKYVKMFAEHEIDMESLRLMTEDQFVIIGVSAVGALNKMMHGIRRLKNGEKGGGNTGAKFKGEEKLSGRSSGDSSARSKTSGNIAGNSVQRGGVKASIKNRSPPASVEARFKARHANKKDHQRPASASLANRSKQPQVVKKRPASAVNRTDERTIDELAEELNQRVKTPSGRDKSSKKTSSREQVSCLEGPDLQSPEGLEDLLSVRSLEPKTQEKSGPIKEDAINTVIEEHPEEESLTEDRLFHIEDQIQHLQGELTDPKAMELIQSLQQQLKDIQSEILQKKTPLQQASTNDEDSSNSNPPIRVPVANPSLSLADELHLDLPKDSHEVITKVKDTSPQHFSTLPPKPLLESSNKMPVPSMGKGLLAHRDETVASMTMSKSELLREVRKQKDQHRKEIRHLESELSRLKHKDPLRTCEVRSVDIILDERDLIGEGAFSHVFRASYQGSIVAVKRLKVPLSSQDKNYFTAEVSLLRELRHPRVVLLLGICMNGPLPLMVLEYMAQGSLYHYLHDPNKPSLDHAAYFQIAHDTALGMNYLHCHRASVLHLDLKSMNVLLTTHLRAKIADFGFSKLRHDADALAKPQRAKQGTPAWMAPELLESGHISPKADVYSFGIILWEMLTRGHPYEGCSMFQIIERTRGGRRPVIPESCPEDLEKLIRACWAHNPSVRPRFKDILTSLEELHFPLEWRSLFTAAGIPKGVLENVESTRTLISIVTETIERGSRPSDVPALNLIDLENEDVQKAKSVGAFSQLSSSDDEAATERYGIPKSVHDKEPVLPNGATEDSAGTFSELAPPPPPLPIPNSAPRRSNLSGTLLEDIKASLQNLQMKAAQATRTDPPKVKGHGFQVEADELRNQMSKLKPTTLPHPSQLRDLGRVQKDDLLSLAEALKKAVTERRMAFCDGDSVDSLKDNIWSLSDV